MVLRWLKVVSALVLVAATIVECNYSDLERTEWQRSSFFYGILSVAASDQSENNSCVDEIKAILDGLDRQELWALKTYDASGSAQSNFIYGQIFWLGSEESCDNLNQPPQMAVSPYKFHELKTSLAPFQMKYAIAYANYTTANQFTPTSIVFVPIHIGLCLPKSCTKNQILNYSQTYFAGDTFRFKKTYKLELDIVEVKKTSIEDFIRHEDIISIICFLLIVVLIVAVFNVTPITSMAPDSVLNRVAKCFNIKDNYKSLMTTSTNSEAIVPVDALKTTVCFLIMLAHMGYFSLFMAGNSGVMFSVYYDTRFLLLFLCTVYVDAFFVSSAFLQCYNFMKNERQKGEILENNIFENIVLYLKLAVHRYLRLTPAFVFTIATAHLVAIYIRHTLPANIPADNELYCEASSFWRSLLYIHGYFSVSSMCASWTWYLSAEMQYYWITLVGLFIYIKNARLGIILYTSLCFVSVIYTYYESAKEDYQFRHDSFLQTINSLYTNPLTRMNPVFPGILGGFLLYKSKKSQIKITKMIIYPWIAASLAMALTIFVGFKFAHTFATSFSHISNSIGRLALAIIFVATILIAHFGHGGYVGKYMRHRYFVHLSKLTYLMYLLNPIIVAFYVASIEKSSTISVSTTYIDGLGVIVVCYLASILSTLFFEIPYYKLSSAFIMKSTNINVPLTPAQTAPAS